MHWKFIVVGKPALGFARAGVDEYLPRLRRLAPAEICFLRDGSPEALQERFEKAAAGHWRVVLDERGKLFSTAELRSAVDRWEMSGAKRVAVMIGPAGGHSPAVRQSADLLLALSPLTFQHELALVAVLEQIYRVYTLKRGEPYHRE
jgi:23S rRNA (pseudouridine1915-N3)-methyltransferase